MKLLIRKKKHFIDSTLFRDLKTERVGTGEKFLKLIKGIYKIPITNIMLNKD